MRHFNAPPKRPDLDADEILPFKDERLEALVQVGGNLSQLQEYFYKPLLKELKKEKKMRPRKVVALLSSAIEKYESMTEERPSVTNLSRRGKDLIEAIMQGDNPDMHEKKAEALELWNQSQES